MSHSRLDPRLPQGRLVALLMTVGSVALGGLIIWQRLADGLLLLLMIPVILSPLFYQRRVYLSLLLIVASVSLVVTYRVSINFGESLKTIVMASFSTLVIAEIVHWLTTRQRRADAALRESEAKYRTLIEMFPQAVCLLQEERLVFANLAALRLLQLKDEEAVRRLDFLHQFIEPPAGELRALLAPRRAEADRPAAFRARLRRPSGGEFSAEVSLGPTTYGGRPALQMVITDITARLQAEESLRLSEERYRSISEISQDFAYAARWLDGQRFALDWITEAFGRITGYTSADLPASDGWFGLCHPADAILVKQHFQRILQGRQDSSEFRILTRAGELRWVRHSARPVWQRPGEPVSGYLGAVQDITERKQAETALQEANQKLQASVQGLERAHREALLINEMSSLLQSCLEVDEVYAVLARYAGSFFPRLAGALYTFNTRLAAAPLESDPRRERRLLEARLTWGGEALLSELVFAPDDCWALRRGHTHLSGTPNQKLRCRHLTDGAQQAAEPAYICQPITGEGETLGLLYLQLPHGEDEEVWRRLVVSVAERVSLALASLRLRARLIAQSLQDDLTGLYNRRYIMELLEHELRRAVPQGSPVTIALMDIDQFKRINDRLGHRAGDAAIQAMAGLIRAECGAEATVARVGGDEFMLVMPGCGLEIALQRAEALRLAAASLEVVHAGQPLDCLTISMGLAGSPLHGEEAQDLLGAANLALTEAKRGGRDRVVIAGGG